MALKPGWHQLPRPTMPGEMPASGYSGCLSDREHLAASPTPVVATSLFFSTHHPSVQPIFDKLRRAVVIATARSADALGDHYLSEFLSALSRQTAGLLPNGCLSLQTCMLQCPPAAFTASPSVQFTLNSYCQGQKLISKLGKNILNLFSVRTH